MPIPRAYFWNRAGGSGEFPIDEELNLPEKHYSYLLQNWNQLLAVDGDFDGARETLERILGINVWTKQSEEINRNAAQAVRPHCSDGWGAGLGEKGKRKLNAKGHHNNS